MTKERKQELIAQFATHEGDKLCIRDRANLKNMETGEQTELEFDKIAQYITEENR